MFNVLLKSSLLGSQYLIYYYAAKASKYNKMENQDVHEYMQLYTTSDKFYLKPSQLCSSSKEVLIIDRQSGEAAVKNIDLLNILGPEKDFKVIFGFLGSIKLISGLYLVVVTDRTLVGKINGRSIFQVAGTEIIPYVRSTNHLTKRQIEDNEKYEHMVRLILNLPGAYFSCTNDLTHTFQDINSLATSKHYFTKSLLARADKRFLWNRHLLKDFTSSEFGRFTLPLIQGFVSINHTQVKSYKLSWALISRRSVDRTGTRLFVRGVDAQGNVANHVVTEQVVESAHKFSSFVLTRGSVPLPWTQFPDLSFKPSVNVAKKNRMGSFRKHFYDQTHRYGDIVCVNLISQHGKEGVLEEAYRAAVDDTKQFDEPQLAGLKYRPFDFHSECGLLRYDKLNTLIDSISKELEEFGYFFIDGAEVVQRQCGTFRVNCLDCLDRTNVVQSILAKLQLKAILKQFVITNIDEEQLSDLDHVVNNVWADHADMISMQYSGTGALKTDYTRTGQRTYSGLIQDAHEAITRYYMNNFTDGFKQDAFDVFLGNYTVPDGKYNRLPSPLSARHSSIYYTLPSIFLVAVSMFSASLILPASYSIETLLCLTICAFIATVTLAFIFRNGNEFVDWPKLRSMNVVWAPAIVCTSNES